MSNINIDRRRPSDILHNSKNCLAWLEGRPYLHLLKEYIERLLLQSSDNDERPSDKELFLNLVVQYWIDLATTVHRDHHKAVAYRKLLTATTNAKVQEYEFEAARARERDHPKAAEVINLDTASFQWTTSTCQCTYLLLWMLFEDCAKYPISFPSSTNGLDNSRVGRQRSLPGRGLRQELKLYSSARPFDHLLFLQAPLYNMLLCIFSRGDRSDQINSEVVYLAADIWMLWMQPWSYVKDYFRSTGNVRSMQFFKFFRLVFGLVTAVPISRCRERRCPEDQNAVHGA